MKKRVYNRKSLLLSLLLFIAVSITLSAQQARKEVSKSYDVKKGFTFNVDTKYSDVEILTWDKNLLDVLVVVTVDASNRDKAEDFLKKINIDITESANSVTFQTDFDFEGSWGKNIDLEIHYTVKLPAYLNVTAENAYGNMYIQEISGLVSLDIQYGNLKADRLLRGNVKPYNSLDLAYGNAEFDQAGWMDLNISYSELNASRAEFLMVGSKYSKLGGEKAGIIITEGRYDKYLFDEIDNFVADLKYSNVRFGKMNKKMDITASYTNVKLDMLSKGFEQVSSDLSYGNFVMGTEPGVAFNLKAESKYGGIDIEPEAKLSKSKENSYVKVWGTVGSGAKADVDVITRYGNIDIR